MNIDGKYSARDSAAQTSASLNVESDVYALKVDGLEQQTGTLDQVAVSSRLGNSARTLTMANGDIFVTLDNDSVDRVFSKYSLLSALLHKVEANLTVALVTLLLVIGLGLSFFKWGVPWVSTQVAKALPSKVNSVIGSHALDFLDDYMFESSNLNEARKNEIRQSFVAELLPTTLSETDSYRLHFRRWEVGDKAVPNALALPSGDLILTDRFVELSQHNDEINAVLLHEIGHVERRHSLQMLIGNTLVATVVFVALGDTSFIADMGVGLGSLVVSSNYSRTHETEADIYAFHKMLALGIAPQRFSDILQRITDDMGDENSSATATATAPKPERAKHKSDKKDWVDYVSSHPTTEDRKAVALHYQTCFDEGLTHCPEYALTAQ